MILYKRFISFFIVLAISVTGHADENPNPSLVDTKMQPTIGYPKAPVQVVALLEPKCPDSKNYNNTVFPKLEEEFINTNKVRYTVIPVSFLPNSRPAAIALLCVFNQNTQYPNNDLFFKYLNYIYKNQPSEKDNWATVETLQKFAAATSPAIQLGQLKKCIEMEDYHIQIEQNTVYGNSLMKGHLSTPTLFVDGVQVDSKDDAISFEILKKAITEALQNKKV